MDHHGRRATYIIYIISIFYSQYTIFNLQLYILMIIGEDSVWIPMTNFVFF